jgi:hypothetical protein
MNTSRHMSLQACPKTWLVFGSNVVRNKGEVRNCNDKQRVPSSRQGSQASIIKCSTVLANSRLGLRPAPGVLNRPRSGPIRGSNWSPPPTPYQLTKLEKGQEGAEKAAKSDGGFAPGHFWPAARAPGITLSPALRNRTPQIGPKSSFLRNWRPPNRSQTLVSDVCHAPNRSQIVLPAQLDPHIGPKSAILRKWTPRNSPQWIKNPC